MINVVISYRQIVAYTPLEKKKEVDSTFFLLYIIENVDVTFDPNAAGTTLFLLF